MARYNGLLPVLALTVVLIGNVQSANILGLFTSVSPSHLIVELSMAKVLAENGHNVTIVTVMKPLVTHKNFNVIMIPLTEEEERGRQASLGNIASIDNTNMIKAAFHLMGQMNFMFDKMRNVMMSPRVKDLYENKDNKFDLVIVGFFLNNYQIGVAQKLKVPVVIASILPTNELFANILGNPRELSYVPFFDMALKQGETMTLPDRVKTLFISLTFRALYMVIEKRNSEYYTEIFGDDPEMPRYEDLGKNVSLVLFNSHAVSEGPIRPNVPAVIEVGGIHIKDQPDPLPKNIAEFLDTAPNDAILLSLGSNVQGEHLKPETVQKMFNVLSKLKQRVVWKWENLDKTPGKSSNILFSKWLPQDDILAHPKIKLFITHAGKGGVSEAQYHGKPMLALPVFGDQPVNAEKMVQDGFGLSMKLLELEEQHFHENILKVLEDSQFTENVKRFSQVYRDRPMTARQTVLYWTEYVLRHHGAPHLQSPVVHMSFIAAHNLDVYALIISLLLVFLFATKLVVRFIYRKFIKRKISKHSSKKKVKKT
ncbi:UDP-glucuronosyltransferase 1-1-like [Scaptodrosophila lebanonensis]|uniref:UDP-glucuronosyltransferase 1-1-like n=1 Tax=Drosophila lebanonensis TaxID=7225 RepID=A0A6J2TS93_DROLE|nr:UDP-glucuronosyltransferase 1-1-like [Scaptodrosophila lebanonensis]